MESYTNVVDWAFSGAYDDQKPVIIDAVNPERYLSKQKVIELVTKLAGSFKKDTAVCVHAGNEILYPVLVLAILASGCRWTGSNPAYKALELSHHLKESDARYVITDPAHAVTVKKALETLPEGTVEIVLLSDILAEKPQKAAEHRMLHDLLNNDNGAETLRNHLHRIEKDSVAALMSTSGTTGLPKMTQRTHKALILETQANEDNNDQKPYEIRRLYCTPVFHGFSFPEMVIASLRLGIPSYYSKMFDPASFPDLVQKHNITETAAAAPMLLALTEQASSDPAVSDKLQSLRMVLCGGAQLLPEVRLRFLDLFKDPPRVVQVWGMTEYGWVATFKYPEDDDTGSVGRMNPLGAVRAVEKQSTDAGDGKSGMSELWIKGPQMMCGYRGNDSATAEVMTEDGWLKTGDIGYVSDGKVYLSGRGKEMIKVDGLAVSPSELESAVCESGDIVDAAAIGAGSGTEEHPVLFVVPARQETTVKDVKKELLRRVANFKVARCEVRFVDAIPRGSSGKVLRNDLRKALVA